MYVRCPFNKGWLSSCYDKYAVSLIGSNTVICSGVTMGTGDAMLAYVSLLLSFILYVLYVYVYDVMWEADYWLVLIE